MKRPHLRLPPWPRRSPRDDATPARKRARRWVIPVVLLTLVVLVVAAAWVGLRAWSAKGELEQAQGLVADLEDRVADGDYAGAAQVYDEIRQHAATARGLTEGPLWRVAEDVPFAGVNLTAMRGLTAVVDEAMTAGEPLVTVALDLVPALLAPEDGRVPIEPVVRAAADIGTVAERFSELRTQLAEVPTDGTVRQLQDAKITLTEVLDAASTALNDVAPFVRTLPGLLGADGPRTYVVMFLNTAELRSLGGTALSFAEIAVDQGAIDLVAVIPTAGGPFPAHATPIIPVPDGFDSIYPNALGRFVANATLRPSAVTAAEIVVAEWEARFGTTVDGVVSMDAGALRHLLEAVGPIPISTGDVVGSENVVSLLFNEVYKRYDTGDRAVDDALQGVVYGETVAGTFAKLTSGQFEPRTLVDSLYAAADEGHLDVWLTDPAEGDVLATTPFAAQGLVESTETTDVVGVYLNDQVGSKVTYYLGSTVTTGSAVCTPDGRQVHRVTVDLTNGLDPAEAADLAGTIWGGTHPGRGLVRGEQKLVVFVYLPKGATVLSASVYGTPVAVTGQVDSGHPVQVLWVQIRPGETSQLSVDVLMGEPGSQDLAVDVTPTVQGTSWATAPLECGTVTLP